MPPSKLGISYREGNRKGLGCLFVTGGVADALAPRVRQSDRVAYVGASTNGRESNIVMDFICNHNKDKRCPDRHPGFIRDPVRLCAATSIPRFMSRNALSDGEM